MKNNPLIGIIDTNTSNIKSVYYALSLHNENIKFISSNKDFKEIDAMIVPGIGNFSYVMKKLKENNLDEYILNNLAKNIPSLFICVGMQILFSKSFEFGEHKGLNILKGEVKKIISSNKNDSIKRKIPMIGWNKLIKKNNSEILNDLSPDDFFYFTHSFYVKPEDKKIISSMSSYLDFEYCSSLSKKNIFATQFHPEKSGGPGLKIYKNFVNLI